tara:strand:+ start:16414 stop:16914 length:501 start_codon:yes stop_codon:yes gene_type:complete
MESDEFLSQDINAFASPDDRVAVSHAQQHIAVQTARLQQDRRKLRKMKTNLEKREETVRHNATKVQQQTKYVEMGFKEVNRVRSFNAFKTQQLNDTLKTVQDMVAKLPRCHNCYGFNVTSQYSFACGHMCLCEECYEHLQIQNKKDLMKCPVCCQPSAAVKIIPFK